MFRSPIWTWLKQVSKARRTRVVRDPRRGMLYVEVLEDRTLLNATVTDVTTTLTPNSTLNAGQTATINVDFSQAVTVTGTPTLALNHSATTLAQYSGGSGTSSLQFTFIVPTPDSASPLDYLDTTALSLSGGSINDRSDAAAATLTLQTPATANFDYLAADNITVDGNVPAITTQPSNQTVTAGGNATFSWPSTIA